MKIRLIIPFIILALLLSAWVPASASSLPAATSATTAATTSTVQLIVDNKTGQTFTLTMKGPVIYNWTVKPGKSTFTTQVGKYKYSYKACGGTVKTGTVVVQQNKQTLVLAVCRQQNKSKEVKVSISNDTHGILTLRLTGPAYYYLTLQTGKSTITVIRGKYDFTAWGCGGASLSGVKNLTGRQIWTFYCH